MASSSSANTTKAPTKQGATLSFPDSFIFGSSTSSFQVENIAANTGTDWGAYIHDRFYEIVRPGEVGPQWDDLKQAERDVQMMRDLGLDLQRISIEWGRVCPRRGEFDEQAINYYKQLIHAIKKVGIEPMVTLHHFTLPDWVAISGGWENPQTVQHFLRYVQRIVSELPDVKHWLVINEPGVQAPYGYIAGYFPPHKTNIVRFFIARNNLIRAHKKGYRLIKSLVPQAQVGSAFSCMWLRPNDPHSRLERFGTYLGNYIFNTNYIAACANDLDFIGLNYYFGYYFDLRLSEPDQMFRQDSTMTPANVPFLGVTVRPRTFRSDFGWPIAPDFFYSALRNIYDSYKKPIFVTENGIADRDDVYRGMYTLTHLVALQRAVSEGANVRGYAHWSTIDNLEWNEGYSKRFGLIKLNPVTGERKLQRSAHLYSEIAKTHTIDIDHLVKRYIRPEIQPMTHSVIRELLQCHTVRGMRLQYCK